LWGAQRGPFGGDSTTKRGLCRELAKTGYLSRAVGPVFHFWFSKDGAEGKTYREILVEKGVAKAEL